MEIRLKYPPIPESAPKFAADIIDAAAEISGVELDYSVESLQHVDDIIEGMRQDGCTSDEIAGTLFCFGCYVGEVFTRNAGGHWRLTSETSMGEFAGFPLVVQLGDDSFCNPIGKVFKRLDNGDEDNLPYFYQVFTSPDDRS